VQSLISTSDKRRGCGVRVIDAETKQTVEYFARIIFLNAGTLNTTLILMNSTSAHFPAGFANSSGVLGHYLMDHQEAGGAMGFYEGFADKYYMGRKPNGMYIPRFRNITEKRADYSRGFAYEAYSGRENWQRGFYRLGMGEDFKN